MNTSPSPIVPRWEWRVAGEPAEAAAGQLADLVENEGARESDELYVLSADGEDSVKIREGLMDVKHRQEVRGDGLERWCPVLKAAFPLSATDVGTMLGALRAIGLPPEPVGTVEELAERLRRREDVRTVEVHKRRRKFELGGCMAEVSDLRTDGREVRTLAVESEDPERLLAVVREHGLDAAPNVSVVRALKLLAGFGGRRAAVVDVGTNSVKFQVAEQRPDGTWRTLVDRAEVTRLGEGTDERGRLGEEAKARTLEAIAGMAAEARRAGAEELAAVGTAALRKASDGAGFVDAVEERCGVRIDVISGEEEARLAYLAAVSALVLPSGPVVVFDTGGGSSQFTFGHGARVDEQVSVDVGAVRLTAQFGLDGAVSEDTLRAAREAVAADFGVLDGKTGPAALVGLGGAVTNLAAVKLGLATYDPEVVQGAVLDRAEVDRQLELYRTRSSGERRSIVGLQPGRAEVILAGACIVRTVLDRLDCDSLTVSDRGLRHGVLVDRFGSGGR
jgi:exopolyphosphatase/guanosine-5'-triphosphate,3'-diphosphate pyrophosphatase